MAAPTQPSFIPQAWASGTGNFDTIPATQQETGRASWDGGFPLENTIPVAQGGVPANYRDFQGVLNALSQFAVFQQAGGVFAYSAEIDYPAGAIVTDGTAIYQCILANGPGTTAGVRALSDTSYWISFLPLSGGTMTGSITTTRANSLHRELNTGTLQINGGTSASNGASLLLTGAEASSSAGYAYLIATAGTETARVYITPAGTLVFTGTGPLRPDAGNNPTLGLASNKWGQIYSTNSTISTSDERLKANIRPVDDTVLDAWGNVQWHEFQFIDSLSAKSEKARLHTGLVAQRIQAAFADAGLDASRYGLFCYDEWEATEAVVNPDTGEIMEPAHEAGNGYSVRYEEALAMEAIYQRRRADRLEERIARLEALIDGDMK